MLRLVLAVTLSGAASLMYQVAWTRRVITITSATVTAQAFVLGVFMAGLGLGAWIAGRRARAVERPLMAYALVEVAALAFALLSLPMIGASDVLRVGLGLGPELGRTAQLAGIAAFLLIPTTLLGASLPLVIEHLHRLGRDTSPSDRGRITGWLYGFNTLGAAAGCALAGFVTIEQLGLVRTTLVGAGLAVAAAALAVLIERGAGAAKASASSGEDPAGRTEPGLLLVAGLSGFVGLGAEVAWTRLIALIVPNTVYAFSQVLVAVLIGVFAGAAFAAEVARRARAAESPRQFALTAAGQLQLLAALQLAAVPLGAKAIADMEWFQYEVGSGLASFGAAALLLCLLVPPAAFVAAMLPLCVMGSEQPRSAHSFGAMYGANVVGSVAGSVLVGLLIMPALGMGGANGLLTATAIAVGGYVLFRAGQGPRQAAFAGLIAVGALVMHLSIDLPMDIYAARVPANSRVLEFREGRTSDVFVTEGPRRRRLWLNSQWVAQAKTHGQDVLGGAHGMLGHIPTLLLERPRRGLGIALGTGQTFAAMLEQGIEHFDTVEINDGVIDLSRKWFAPWNRGLLDDPRVTVHHDDGRAFMRATASQYDLLVLEPLQAWSVGTTNLYTREFYEEARRVLGPSAVMAQWIPFYGQGPSDTRAMVRAAIEVFPEASLWLSAKEGILVLGTQPFELDVAALERRIGARKLFGELPPDEAIVDLMSLFMLGRRGLAAWVEGAPLLSDDRPFLEFNAARDIGVPYFRPILRSMLPHLEDPADYLTGARTSTRALAVARAIRQATLQPAADAAPIPDRAAALEAVLDLAPRSPELLTRYRRAIAHWVSAVPPTKDGLQTAAAIYERALEHDPGNGITMLNLAAIYGRLGQLEAGRPWARRAAEIPAHRAQAERLLERLGASPTSTP